MSYHLIISNRQCPILNYKHVLTTGPTYVNVYVIIEGRGPGFGSKNWRTGNHASNFPALGMKDICFCFCLLPHLSQAFYCIAALWLTLYWVIAGCSMNDMEIIPILNEFKFPGERWQGDDNCKAPQSVL